MRWKGLICQNLLLSLKHCCSINFYSSLIGFTAHLHTYISNKFRKFEQNCFTGFDFIRKTLGIVFIERVGTSAPDKRCSLVVAVRAQVLVIFSRDVSPSISSLYLPLRMRGLDSHYTVYSIQYSVFNSVAV